MKLEGGCYCGAVRYKAWKLSSALHPNLPEFGIEIAARG